MSHRGAPSLLVALLACSPAAPPVSAPRPVPVPVAVSPEAVHPLGPAPATDPRRASAEAAWQAGWMPLWPTRVPTFAAEHPQADGRGVLIAILDSGIDPSVPGLQRLPDGGAKLLDLRDFSGEGRVALQPITRRGDTLLVASRSLGGASRVAALASGPFWGGLIAEVDRGKPPAADLNANHVLGDTLLVVVGRGPSGWVLFADRHGDGSLVDDAPVRDYAVAREWFGWSPRGYGPALSLAVNLADSAGAPVLDLLFDTSGHGTHVAGIAAGHALYGVPGFDGVAPGAMLLGLKIASNAEGGITVPGSIVRALEHAIGVARARAMPLVVNLSFGVGNEEEGAAEVDALVDGILAANPDVVMTVAASNDGPGLSTLGFPGSAVQVLSVGATQPLVFTGLAPDDPTPDPIAYFSSRGGELAGPDLVTPGTAYSTVPAYSIGEEQNSGTSMAAPHAAGLAARLVGLLHARGVPVQRRAVMHALRATAVPVPGATVLDQGSGVPDLAQAARWLGAHPEVPQVVAAHAGRRGRAAILLDAPATGTRGEVTLRRLDRTAPLPVRLRVPAPWLAVDGPAERTIDAAGSVVSVRVLGDSLPSVGVWTASLVVEHATDEGLGPLVTVPVTIRRPLELGGPAFAVVQAGPGAAARVPVVADTGRGVRLTVATLTPDMLALAALHEPGGQPFRDGGITAAGFADGAALFEVDGGDVVGGMYEVVVIAPPTAATAARVAVERAPVRLGAARLGDSLEIRATSLVTAPITLRLRTALTGAAWRHAARGDGREEVRLAVPVPAWAARITVDAEMARARWPAFTDFGVTLRERNGTLLEEAPLNYAFGRLTADVPERLRGDTLTLVLSPAAADATQPAPWELALRVRFGADRPWALDDGGTTRDTLAPGAVRRARFSVATWPLDLGAGFAPLITVVALEGDDAVWTRELPLWGGGGPTR